MAEPRNLTEKEETALCRHSNLEGNENWALGLGPVWAAIVCMQERWLGLMTAPLSHLHPLPSHRMSAHKAQVCILRGNCLDLSVEMLSMLKGCNSSETNTLCASQDDIDVHMDKTQDEFKEA